MLKHKIVRSLFCLTVASLGYFWWTNTISFWCIIVTFCAFISLTIWGVFDVRLSYFTPMISSGNKQGNVISLTFDDGPTEHTTAILELLKRYNYQATFFCIGKQLEKYPEIAKEIVARGHTIANHTYSHTEKMGFLSASEVVREIQQTNYLIEKTVGVKPLLFRPPFGVTNPSIAKAAKRVPNQFIGWNIRSLDTVLTDEHKIFSRVVSRLKPGGIVLMHDTSIKSVNALEQLLQYLSNSNYQVVALTTLLKMKEYEI